MLQAAYQLTDAFWVGRLGEKGVAAVAISGPVIFLLTSFGVGLAVAGATLTSQYFGAKNEKMLGHSAAQTLLMVIISSIILSVSGYLLSPYILKLIGASDDIAQSANQYLRISFLGMVLNFIFFMFQSIMRSIGKAKIPMFIIIGTVSLNFALDHLFMFGFGPIPSLGVAGVAMATIGTELIAAAIGLMMLFGGKHGIHLKLKDFKPDWKFIKKAFQLGLPSSIEQSARSLSLNVITAFIASFGTLAVAAYGASSNILHMILIASFGLAGANAALVGNNLGAQKPETADATARTSLKIIFLFLLTMAVIIFFNAEKLISFFVPNDLGVINAGAHALRFLCFSFPLIGIQIIIGSSLQAAGMTKQSMIMTISSQWLIQIPLAFLLSKKSALGMDGLWLSFPLTNLVASIIYITVFLRGKWKKKTIISHDDKTSTKIMTEVESQEVVPAES